MVGTAPDTAPATGLLVIVDATAHTARTAHVLDCRTVFVQRPGTPVHELVDDSSGYYSVDFTQDTLFTGFVEEVLRPLAPTAVISLSDEGARAAALANAVLGTAGTPVEVIERLAAGPPGEAAHGATDRWAYTFSEAGRHRWVALMGADASPLPAERVLPEEVLSADEYESVGAALNGFLDAAGLRNGPARIRLRGRDGEVRVLGGAPTVGTDEQSEFIRRHTGFDLTHAALAGAVGRADDRLTGPAQPWKEATR
ncbi:hypothetical protein [Streptomyces sp. PTY087I2]|uniref:hypothetical protein n=1 Tax=Streptomyces sp. PTY087I2 TaxID=1819298 RepID=UPI00080AFE40|nr:hypothetical protein [Streptomyces sp. PTY087I2]OCC10717.1 hypothetical protein A3Q37_03564 [Streptomyces sp. PTY087I2]